MHIGLKQHLVYTAPEDALAVNGFLNKKSKCRYELFNLKLY
jgi:hypothetical protein